MKKIFTLVFIMLFSIVVFSVQASASEYSEVKKLNTDAVLIADPNQMIETNVKLKKGTLVTQLKIVDHKWAYIKVNNKKGYVSLNALTTPKSTIKQIGSKNSLVVRAAASKNATKVSTLKTGLFVKDFGSAGNGFSFIQYGNVIGYVNSNALAKAKYVTKTLVDLMGEDVGIRPKPSYSVPYTFKMQLGARVKVYTTSGGWSLIDYNGHQGYAEAAAFATVPYKTKVNMKDYLPNCNNTYSYEGDILGVDEYTTIYYSCNVKNGVRYLYNIKNKQTLEKLTILKNGDIKREYQIGQWGNGGSAYITYKPVLKEGLKWSFAYIYDKNYTYYSKATVMSINDVRYYQDKVYKYVVKIKVDNDYYEYWAPKVGLIATESIN